MCLASAVVASSPLTQDVTAASPFTVMTDIRTNITLGKTSLSSLNRMKYSHVL